MAYGKFRIEGGSGLKMLLSGGRAGEANANKISDVECKNEKNKAKLKFH